MDEDQNSVDEEFTPQDQVSTVVDEQSQEQSIEDNQGQEENSKERDWRALRKKAEADARRAELAEEKSRMQDEFIKNLLAQSKQSGQPIQSAPKEVDELEDIPDDEYIPKGKSRKMFQGDARKIAREEFLALERERETLRFHERLRSKYSDFDEIVNSETIAILEKNEPELALTIADLKDPYKMGLQSYNIIKAMNLQGSQDEKRHAQEVSKKIEKNEKTLQSPQAYNKRPMAQAFSISHMSNDEKIKIYNEMMGFANQSPGY